MGDFTLRVGSVLLNNVSKNTIVLEVGLRCVLCWSLALTYNRKVEYRPCEQVNGCIALMNEFLSTHFGDLKEGQKLTATAVDFADLPPTYSHRHASLQYARLFVDLGLLVFEVKR